ncbi:MAG TPA: SMP-30/gluconolactonase/LRE family protein [Hyphomonas sp.]|nr:SMP-30/gluconolactonase/LRE family protein [Hyphomonas sp.]
MRHALTAAILGLGLAACAPAPTPASPEPEAPPAPRTWSFAEGEVFPAGRTLTRPESGVVLADGTLVVVDQVNGLTAIAPDGSIRPFGNFAAAGYSHSPPDYAAGPNGAAFEPDGRHVLVADVFTGSLWRTDTETETTTRLYQHPYGINYAHRDSTGAIWFTQSTENAPPQSEARLFGALNGPMPDGALFRIAPSAEGEPLPSPERLLDGLLFANGFTLDETRGKLFLAETVAGRITSYTVDLATGALSDRAVLTTLTSPDNVEQAADGTLWVATPMSNQVLAINPDTGESRVAFSAQTEEAAALSAEFDRRAAAGEPRLELLSSVVWDPMPGLVTGVIHTPGGGPVYISNLGDALLKIEAAE